ncbi:glycosyltransferase family 4 protein [Bradyrhizobium cosmicum]|uniref:Glycosyltransferase n=1 Tax=Bradyrhizobium cosmicum TaxID=1404864 RepID=A0AAI8QDX7_9BRAD|nr:glycosyltransferase family 4 protein [Bradyrhizobium cosmicum]BAL78847.1 putative glycosyltransferase [Bradyrhizobium cosmicum]
MRILILTHEFPPFRGGVGTYCVETARAATAEGCTVEILVPDFGKDNTADDRRYPFAVRRFAGGVYATRALPSLLLALLRARPWTFDVVHAADWPFVMLIPWLRFLMRGRIVATMHGTDVLLLAKSRVAGWLFGRAYLRGADRVVANSRFTEKLVLEHHPYLGSPRRTAVTLLGVDPFWFQPAVGASETLDRHGVPKDRKLLLTVARLDVRKGHRHLLQALALLPQHAKDQLAYVIVGKALDPAYQDELKRLAQASGVPVVFAGAVSNEDVRNFYATAWLFCMLAEPNPEKVEGFGLAYLEAAAQSLPSVAAPNGGVPEVVLDGETGILLADRAPERLADLLVDLLGRREDVARLGSAARTWAQTFSWQRCAELTYQPERTVHQTPPRAEIVAGKS